jgi:hypothetical protein
VVKEFAQGGAAGSSMLLGDTTIISFGFTTALKSNWSSVILGHES